MPAVTLITSIPKFISADEYRTLAASTPSSFNDIPPVLRHQEEHVAVSLDPPLDGLSIDDCAKGTLYVLESVLIFMSSAASRGFRIEYPAITLHAVSRAETGPSIYCQLDETAGEELTATTNGAADDDYADMRELNIVPSTADSLDSIFEALSICASLHPDPPSMSDDEDDDAYIDADSFDTFNPESEEHELSEVGRAALEYMESIIEYPKSLSERPDVKIAEAKEPGAQ